MFETNTRRRSHRPAGSPEAAFTAGSCFRLPQASASLGQSASWAALVCHIGLAFIIGIATAATNEMMQLQFNVAGGCPGVISTPTLTLTLTSTLT